MASGVLRAGSVVHAATVEGAGGGVTGEKAANEVGQSLADEFLVAVDALLGFGGDGAGNGYRFGQCQHGDHQCREQHLVDGGVGKIRQGQRRQMGRQGADCFDLGDFDAEFHVDEKSHDTAHHHGDDHVGQLGDEFLGQNAGHQVTTPTVVT